MSAAPPRVAVLLPVRDGAAWLPSALGSLARQSLADWECLVVDDGSRDDTAAVAATAGAADARIRLLRQERLGLVPALQAGLAAAGSPFVARMDADDVAHPRRLEWQLAALEADDGLAGVGGHVRLFPRRELGPGIREYEAWIASLGSPEDVRREAFVECPLVHPTLCLRREVLVAAGGCWPGGDTPGACSGRIPATDWTGSPPARPGTWPGASWPGAGTTSSGATGRRDGPSLGPWRSMACGRRTSSRSTPGAWGGASRGRR